MTEQPQGGTQEGRWEDAVPEGLNDELDEPLARRLERAPGSEGDALEDGATYEAAVEDGAPLPASGEDPGAGPDAPEFREPV